MAIIRHASEKYVGDALETAKAYTDSQRLGYEEERILVSQKPLLNTEEDFISSDYMWDDTSLKLNDGDIIKLHISNNLTGKDASIKVSLYYMDNNEAPWGDRQFEIPEFGGVVFGYVGTVDDKGHYNGVRIIIPGLFDGAIEISDFVVIKQLDEKFIPNSIARKSDIVQPDYNQGDESKPDYIKNRPFYEYKDYLCNKSYTAEEVISQTDGVYEVGNIAPNLNEVYNYKIVLGEPTEGQDATGFTLEGEAQFTDNGDGSYIFGIEILDEWTGNLIFFYNKHAVNKLTLSSGQIIQSFGSSLSVEFWTNEVKQIDEKFIPDTIARKEDVTELYGIITEIDTALDRVIEKYGLGGDAE